MNNELISISLLQTIFLQVKNFFNLDYLPYYPAFRLLPQAASGAFRSDGIACGLLPGLTRRQRSVCARHPGAIQYVIEGLNAAAQECQLQFADQRWNCTAAHAGFALPQLKSEFSLKFLRRFSSQTLNLLLVFFTAIKKNTCSFCTNEGAKMRKTVRGCCHLHFFACEYISHIMFGLST